MIKFKTLIAQYFKKNKKNKKKKNCEKIVV